nr:MAG TPA: hypothetical protein [Caudoviricetes sp.]
MRYILYTVPLISFINYSDFFITNPISIERGFYIFFKQ